MIFATLSLDELARQVEAPIAPSASAAEELVRRFLAGDLSEVDEDNPALEQWAAGLESTSTEIEEALQAHSGSIAEIQELLEALNDSPHGHPGDLSALLDAAHEHADPVALLRAVERFQNALIDLAEGHGADLAQFGELNLFSLEQPMSPDLEKALIALAGEALKFFKNLNAATEDDAPSASVIKPLTDADVASVVVQMKPAAEAEAAVDAQQANKPAPEKAAEATEEAKPIEYGQVSQADLATVKRVGQPAVLKVFATYGIKVAKELKPEQYGQFLQSLEALQNG